jgi:hypothetical protein
MQSTRRSSTQLTPATQNATYVANTRAQKAMSCTQALSVFTSITQYHKDAAHFSKEFGILSTIKILVYVAMSSCGQVPPIQTDLHPTSSGWLSSYRASHQVSHSTLPTPITSNVTCAHKSRATTFCLLASILAG